MAECAQVLMMLTCTVLLYKLYHRLGSVFLMKDLAEPVSKADPAAVAACPAGELAAFRFFHGMLLVRPPPTFATSHKSSA